MKRKVYVTDQERRADQIKGFLAFPIVNVLLWIILQLLYSLSPTQGPATNESVFVLVRCLIFALPWLVNGSVLALALIFRPQFGVGYIAFVTGAFTVIILLGTLFVAACFVSILSALVLGPLAIIVFIILMLVGLYFIARLAFYLFESWQSSDENTSPGNGGSTS